MGYAGEGITYNKTRLQGIWGYISFARWFWAIIWQNEETQWNK